MIQIQLPFPPSVNALYRNPTAHDNVRRRIKTKKYSDWLAEAQHCLLLDPQPSVSGPYELEIAVGRPDKRRRDLDNLIKPISDFLTMAGLIKDDADAQRIVIEWGAGNTALVRVTKVGS